MNIKIILALVVVATGLFNAQFNREIDTNHIVSKADTVKNLTDADSEIIYFSFDNGNTWKNNSSGIPQRASIGLGGVASSEF